MFMVHPFEIPVRPRNPAVVTASKQVATWERSRVSQFIIKRRVECQAVAIGTQLFNSHAKRIIAHVKLWITRVAPWALGHTDIRSCANG
jgi:hypothetical protein